MQPNQDWTRTIVVGAAERSKGIQAAVVDELISTLPALEERAHSTKDLKAIADKLLKLNVPKQAGVGQ